MTDAQFRAWLKNKLAAASARPGYVTGKKHRFQASELLKDLEGILAKAKKRAPRI